MQPQILASSNGAFQSKAIDFEILWEKKSTPNKKKMFTIYVIVGNVRITVFDHSGHMGVKCSEEGN